MNVKMLRGINYLLIILDTYFLWSSFNNAMNEGDNIFPLAFLFCIFICAIFLIGNIYANNFIGKYLSTDNIRLKYSNFIFQKSDSFFSIIVKIFGWSMIIFCIKIFIDSINHYDLYMILFSLVSIVIILIYIQFYVGICKIIRSKKALLKLNHSTIDKA